MPANKEALIRYHAIDKALRNKYRKFPSLERLVESCSEVLGKKISPGTIQKDIYAMRHEAGLGWFAPIEYNSLEKGYAYTDPDFSISKVPVNEQEVEAILFATAILNQFRDIPIFKDYHQAIDKILQAVDLSSSDAEDLHSFISLEKAPYFKGSHLLGKLAEAIKNRITVCFDYAGFERERAKSYVVYPYLLKEYRNRWYLLGTAKDNEEKKIQTFGLDRMEQLQHCPDIPFCHNHDFDPEQYFRYAFGITAFTGTPEEIIIRFEPLSAKYVLTQPLHHTQRVLEETDRGIRISIFTGITIELIMTLLSYGENAEVISPPRLRETLAQSLQKALNYYR